MIIVRYAKDLIVGFQHEVEARTLPGDHARAAEGVLAVAASGQDQAN
jgi:hypothetical protein